MSTATIIDNTPNLTVDIVPGSDVHATIAGFGAHGQVRLPFLVTTATIGQVLQSLTSDGSGGTLLPLDTGGSIDFLGLAPGTLRAANFFTQ